MYKFFDTFLNLLYEYVELNHLRDISLLKKFPIFLRSPNNFVFMFIVYFYNLFFLPELTTYYWIYSANHLTYYYRLPQRNYLPRNMTMSYAWTISCIYHQTRTYETYTHRLIIFIMSNGHAPFFARSTTLNTPNDHMLHKHDEIIYKSH